MFVTIEQFRNESKGLLANTQKLFDTLTDASLEQKITDDHRSLGQIAWHLVESIQLLSMVGLTLPTAKADESQLKSAKYIANQYKKMTESLLNAVTTQWNDQSLQESKELFGQVWKNGETLRFTVINHTIHHCGQMTVLMRQAGLSIPGLFGPTKEDQIAQGKIPLV
jgi:uncharacterized damage-inducible protein DinB